MSCEAAEAYSNWRVSLVVEASFSTLGAAYCCNCVNNGVLPVRDEFDGCTWKSWMENKTNGWMVAVVEMIGWRLCFAKY
jgi:3-isopropylmalate dehydratase small subunit